MAQKSTGQGLEAVDGYLLALDAGTGGCRAALFTADGRPAALARRDWSHPADAGIPGSQSFDTTGNWALICACIREVLAAVPGPAAVLAVGCSSMGGGLVLYDRAGRELWACANGDARAGQEAAAMLADGTAAELYRRGGGWISLSAPPRLAWVRGHEPDRWAAAARLSMIADWIVFRLTGTLVTEASIGSTSGMFDLRRRAWSPEIMTLCGLRPALFPEVVEAGTVAGRVSGAAFRQTGLLPGTPVAAGGLDTALGLADPRGAVPGRLTVTGGSFWKQTVTADSAAVEPAGRLRTICHVQPGQWLVEGISFYAGSALRWLRDQGVRAGPRAARRVTPGWSNWRRRCRPGTRPHRATGPGRRLDLGAVAAALSVPADGRDRRAGAGHPGGRRLLHPPDGRADQRDARPRRPAHGDPYRRGGPEHALAADSRRRARQPGRRAGSRRVRGRRRRRPGRPRGRGPAARRRGGRSAGGGPGEPGPRAGGVPKPGRAARL